MIFIPTYLYIKKHKQTGLLYFGKTTRKDPYKYLGSGKYWVKHIKKHGREIETIWAEQFLNMENLIEAATFISEFFDIVKSDKWANLDIENGLDGASPGRPSWNKGIKASTGGWNKGISSPGSGAPGIPKSEEHKKNISTGVKKSERKSTKGRKYPNRKKRENIVHSTITCPVCGIIGGNNVMKRWHFDKCYKR